MIHGVLCYTVYMLFCSACVCVALIWNVCCACMCTWLHTYFNAYVFLLTHNRRLTKVVKLVKCHVPDMVLLSCRCKWFGKWKLVVLKNTWHVLCTNNGHENNHGLVWNSRHDKSRLLTTAWGASQFFGGLQLKWKIRPSHLWK